MAAKGEKKASLSIEAMLLRGFMSGMILGFATAVSMTAVAEGGPPILGALLFPAGFVILMLLGFELVTGNFALVPSALLDRRIGWLALGRNWLFVFIGNLLGSVLFATLLYAFTTKFGHVDGGALGKVIVARAEAKTLAYAHAGTTVGVVTAFLKGILCNWMVATGTVMSLISHRVTGKILAMWLPIFSFFTLGLEHSVVNMFLIPAGILFGNTITVTDWWIWNQLTVTLGNIVGAFFLVAWVMHRSYGKKLDEGFRGNPTKIREPRPNLTAMEPHLDTTVDIISTNIADGFLDITAYNCTIVGRLVRR